MSIFPRSALAPAFALIFSPAVASGLAPEYGMAFDPDLLMSRYVGGRGLITVEGPTGLFLNPTSGITAKGQLSPQACVFFFDVNGDHATGYGLLLTYGVTDWLDIGVYGLLVDGINPAVTGESTLESGQINARVRLLRDEGGLPEVSVGGFVQEGDEPLRRQTLYIAASKGFDFGTGGLFSGGRLHAGFRHFRQDPDVNEEDGSIFYIGAELNLSSNLFLVGEVSTKDDVFAHTPYAFGIQYRGSSSGLTMAVTQPGNSDDPAYYFGIGVTF